MQINEKNINKIKELCVSYKVRTLSAFGSVVRNGLKGSLPKGSITRTDVAKFLVKSMIDGTSGMNSICNS